VKSIDGKDFCCATCLHSDFVNDSLPCVHRRQNSASSIYCKTDIAILWARLGTGQNLGAVTGTG